MNSQRLDAYPVIGPLLENDFCPNTGFLRFESPCGVHGLAQVEDRHLDVLAVVAVTPGVGQFRVFVNECKEAYDSIRFWTVLEDSMREMLARYAFTKGHDVDKFGEMQEVWDWRKVD